LGADRRTSLFKNTPATNNQKQKHTATKPKTKNKHTKKKKKTLRKVRVIVGLVLYCFNSIY